MPFFQPFRLKTSGSLLNCASACLSSAPSSTAKSVERSPRTNSAATKGDPKKKKKKVHPASTINFTYVWKHWERSVKKSVVAVLNFMLCCSFSLQELLHSSRKLSLKVLSFVQSFQVKTLCRLFGLSLGNNYRREKMKQCPVKISGARSLILQMEFIRINQLTIYVCI